MQASNVTNGEIKEKKDNPPDRKGVPEEVGLPDPGEPNGFDRGYKPKEIVGATELNGHILFLIQWYVTVQRFLGKLSIT